MLYILHKGVLKKNKNLPAEIDFFISFILKRF